MLSEFWLPFPLPGPAGPIVSVNTWTLFFVLAVLIGGRLAFLRMRKAGLPVSLSLRMMAITLLASIIGARLGFLVEIHGHALFNQESAAGGMVFFWGMIAGTAALITTLLFYRVRIRPILDAAALALAPAYAVGRLGCWISGDGCYGIAAPFSLPPITWAFGPDAVMTSHGVIVWNTPFIEALLSGSLSVWIWMHRDDGPPGRSSAIFLIWMGISRFFVEFLRLNDALIPILPHPGPGGSALAHHHDLTPGAEYFLNWNWYGLTEGQIIGFTLTLVGLFWLRRIVRFSGVPVSHR